MRRNLPGTFRAGTIGEGAWRLSRSEPDPIDVFVRGAAAHASESFRTGKVRDLGIEWRADALRLRWILDGRHDSVEAQSAIVHEPLPHLYAALPLATLDERARRFWRRVFRLLRIPGGRHLLGVLARRSRGRH
jgi:hypothetical protein